MKIIETKNLTKHYGKSRGVIDLNLVINEGDIYGFIGPNGAGKSTTIRILLGLLSPTSGQAAVLGKDCVKQKNEILSNVGYMPSESMFYNNMRVNEILKFSAKLHKKDCTIEARSLCDRLLIDTKKRIDELSLGNRKKVSIVCALQHSPMLYILDEPTSGLDPLIQKEFFSILMERHKEGATIFISSHVLSEIQRYCKNAAIIREGEIIISNSVEALSKSSARRVNLYGVSKVPSIEGILDVSYQENMTSFLFNGDMQRLISALNEQPITDMTVSEPDIEEIFMHFYSKGGEQNDCI